MSDFCDGGFRKWLQRGGNSAPSVHPVVIAVSTHTRSAVGRSQQRWEAVSRWKDWWQGAFCRVQQGRGGSWLGSTETGRSSAQRALTLFRMSPPPAASKTPPTGSRRVGQGGLRSVLCLTGSRVRLVLWKGAPAFTARPRLSGAHLLV